MPDDKKEISLEDLGLGILNVPEELQKNMMWAGSTYKTLDPKTLRKDKAPRNIYTGERISVTSPDGWVTFEEAVNSGYPYIGMRLTAEDPYVVIDIDATTDDEVKKKQGRIFSAFKDTYTELSASKKGAHIILKGPSESGRRKDSIEVYSQERYIICTGNLIKGRPNTIADGEKPLADLRKSLAPHGNPDVLPLIDDSPEKETDEMILNRMKNATNADTIRSLFTTVPDASDDWSKLDAQLAQHICFYTDNQQQALRLFRKSKLYRGGGQKSGYERVEKYEEDYLIRQTFANAWHNEHMRRQQKETLKQEEVDKLVERHKINPTENVKIKSGDRTANLERLSVSNYSQWLESETLPEMSPMSGLLGRMSDYIYESSPLPVRTIANAGALSLMAGISGRHYNISGSGLTLYMILLAGTGRGKEAASTGAKRLLSAVADGSMPRAREFDGPSHIASGQGLVRTLAEGTNIPSKVLYLSEFGHTMKIIADKDANAADLKTRQVLLDFYSKSAWGSVINETTYADKQRNTSIIEAPNVTLLGDTTPDVFFSTVKMAHVKEGFLPRFMLIEHEGQRGNINIKKDIPVPADLRDSLTSLTVQVYTLYESHMCIDVDVSNVEASAILRGFEDFCNFYLNSDIESKELWNRAHLKALRLAGLFAVSDNIFNPVVSPENAELAVEYVLRDMLSYDIRMRSGTFGAGERERDSKLAKTMFNYFEGNVKVTPRNSRYVDAGILPLMHVVNELEYDPAFADLKKGARQEIVNLLGYMVKCGIITEIKPSLFFKEEVGVNVRSEQAYIIGPHYYDAMLRHNLQPAEDIFYVEHEDDDSKKPEKA